MCQDLELFLQNFLLNCKTEEGLSENTLLAYRNDLEYFILFLKNTIIFKEDVEKINQEVIKKYLLHLHQKEYSRQSYLRKLSCLKKFFDFLVLINKIKESPVINIKRPKKEKRLPKILSTEEIQKMTDYCFANDKQTQGLIIQMLFCSGMRISELLSIKVSQVREVLSKTDGNNFLRITGKGQKERLVPVKKSVKELLEHYLSKNNLKHSDYLFKSSSKLKRLTREYVGMELKKIANLCNIEPSKVSPHILRHSFATNLCESDVNLRILQELLGHSDISTTEIYIDIANKDMLNFVQKNHPIKKITIN